MSSGNKFFIVLILIIFVIVATWLILSQTNSGTNPVATDDASAQALNEARARDIATNYIRGTAAYATNEGRGIEITSLDQGSCDGCWNIEFKFGRILDTKPGVIDTAVGSMRIENWDVSGFNIR